MKQVGTRKRRWFLKVELVILMCLACVWAFNLGDVYIDGAIAGVLRQVVKIDSDNINAHRFLADHYFYSDRDEEAIKTYKEIVRIIPNDLDAQIDLAFMYDCLGRFEESAQAYREAIRIDPTDADIWTDLGDVCVSGEAYLQIGDRDSALKQHNILKTLDPELATELYDLMD